MLGQRRRRRRRERGAEALGRGEGAAGPRPPHPAAPAGVRRGPGRPGGGPGAGCTALGLTASWASSAGNCRVAGTRAHPQCLAPLPPPPKPGPGVHPRLRASDALEEDSVCGAEEEEEEGVVTRDSRGAWEGPREPAVDWDSGFSEVSGSTWPEEGPPALRRPAPPAWRPHRQRLSASGLPLPGGAPVARAPPAHRPRPKSTPDACLEHWRGLDAEDWTAALLSRGRSRQPLVLGDNCFADLVHNWMELPEAAGEGDRTGAPRARARPPQFLLGLSEQLRRQLARARRAAVAGKRLSCPPRAEPELPTDASRFAALMSCRSRQPIICTDVVSYL